MNDFVDHEIWQVCRNCDHLETEYTYDEEQNNEYEYFYCCKCNLVSAELNKDKNSCKDWKAME